MATQTLIKMGSVILSGMPLTTYNSDTHHFSTIRPITGYTQYLNCTKLYKSNQLYPTYSKIGFYDSPTKFGDLYTLLLNKLKTGEKKEIVAGVYTVGAYRYQNINDEWINLHTIPITHNGEQLQINGHNLYLAAYKYDSRAGFTSYLTAGIIADNTFYGFAPAYVESNIIKSGGIFCFIPYRTNDTDNNLTSNTQIAIRDGWISSYVIQHNDKLNEDLIQVGDTQFKYSLTLLRDIIGDDISELTIDPDNPYYDGGTSETGGGEGSFDDSSDPIDFTQLPTVSAVGSGFVGLFSPTIAQLNNLANYLWNNELDWAQLVKLVANPIDLLISLTIVPIKPQTTTAEDIKVGFINTGVSVNKVVNQYVKFNCGTLTVDRYYDSALDFSPFTKISIYLPYIGQRQLNADEVVGNELEIEYNIDLFTGACVAEIKVAGTVLYSFEGNVATQIPLVAESFDRLGQAIIGAVATVATVAMSAGAGAAAAGAESTAAGASTSAAAGAGAKAAGGELAKAAPKLASAGANTVVSSKPTVTHAGSASANIGQMSQKTPYLIYEIPRQSLAESYQVFNGLPSNITATLGDLSGFTQVERIHLENIPATSGELTLIENALKTGVII